MHSFLDLTCCGDQSRNSESLAKVDSLIIFSFLLKSEVCTPCYIRLHQHTVITQLLSSELITFIFCTRAARVTDNNAPLVCLDIVRQTKKVFLENYKTESQIFSYSLGRFQETEHEIY